MSLWTQVSGFSKYASDAIKTAQNNIEKVLDEKENQSESFNSNLSESFENAFKLLISTLEVEKSELNQIEAGLCKDCSDFIHKSTENRSNKINDSKDILKNSLESLRLIEKKIEKQSKITENEHDYEALIKEGQKLSEEIIKKNELIKNLREKVKNFDSKAKDNQLKINQLKEEVGNLEGIIELSEFNNKENLYTIKDLQNNISLLESGSVEKSESYQNIIKNCEDLRTENVGLKKKIEDLSLSKEEKSKFSESLKQDKIQNERLRSKISDLELKISEAEKENDRLSQYYKGVMEKSDALKEELTEKLQSANEPLFKEINDLRKKLERERKNFMNNINNLNIELEMKSIEISRLNDKIKELKEPVSNASQLKDELIVKNKEIKNLLQEIKRINASQDQLNNKRNHDIEKLKKENMTLLEDLKTFKREKSDWEITRNQYEEKMRIFREEEEELRRLMEKNIPYTNRIQMMKDSIAREQTSSMTCEIISDKDVISSTGFGFMENMKQNLNLKELDNKQLKSEVNRLHYENEELIKELALMESNTQRKLQEINTRYETLLELHGEKIEELEQVKIEFKEVKENFKNQINALMR